MPQFDLASPRRGTSFAKRGPRSVSRWAVVVVFAVGSVAVAGCGEGPSSGSTAASQTGQPIASVTPAAPVAVTSDRYETTLERRGGKVRVAPVPDSYRPKISRAEALEAFKRQGVLRETAARAEGDVRLGLYSSSQISMTRSGALIDQPVWVIHYGEVPAEADPGPLGIAGAPTVPAGTPVNVLVFVDAETGQFLNAIQDPVGAS